MHARLHLSSYRYPGIGVRQTGQEGHRKRKFSVDVLGQGWEQRKNSRDPNTSIASKDEASFEAALHRVRFEHRFSKKNGMARKTLLVNGSLQGEEATIAIDGKVGIQAQKMLEG